MRFQAALLSLVLVSASGVSADPFAAFGGSVLLHQNTLYISEASGFHEPGQVHIVKQQGDGAWQIVQSVMAADGQVGDRFGSAVSAHGDLLVVGASAASDGNGRVYIFRRGSDGLYSQAATLDAPSANGATGFASSVAIVEEAIVVGAPRASDGAGQVHVFVYNSGEWVAVATLRDDGDDARFGSALSPDGNRLAASSPGAAKVAVFEWSGVSMNPAGTVIWEGDMPGRFGSSVHLQEGRLAIGAPAAERVHTYFWRDGEWQSDVMIEAPESFGERSQFGSSVQVDGRAVWIGAPWASGGGQLMRWDESGPIEILQESGLSGRPSFGAGFAASGDFLAVGAAGDAYGEGTAFVYRRGGDGWAVSDVLYNAVDAVPAVAGAEVECSDGAAGPYSCNRVDLLAFLPNEDMEINRGVRLNDIWGWTDPETGKEYALVGHMEAMAVVDVSSPTGPVYLGTLPRTEGSPGSTWRDIKVYRDHAFIVADGAGQHGMQVLDLRQLRDLADIPVTFEPTAFYDGIASAHNIVINEDTGYAYTVGNSSGGETCGGGLHMIDIRDPANPTFVGCFTHSGTNSGGGGATHDAQCVSYQGPDSDHRGQEICVSSNGAALSISDVSDKDNPVAVSQATYPNYAYVHQGWFTDDQRYFYQNDEGDELSGLVDRTRTLIWDLTDLDDPQMIGEFFGPTNATDHNLYVDGNLMYQTNNASGLRIVDISDPENPVEVGHFDTTPYGNDKAGFNGTWSSYPYFGSGTLVVTSRREGLFLVRKRNIDT
ncbi:MAG: choice-of-anchor B family protein [Rhodothermales bacterium]|nr:choice-of-anchor B family protein [Rhodothermales bacterium]MBO6779444.1 choice-of-anchor B family protein [Rhodothermales bacterium]